MKKHFYILSLVFVAACSAAKMIPPVQADADRGKSTFADLTLAQLTEGQQVYMTSCNKCHPYKKPGSRTAEDWKEVIPEMTVKANHKLGNVIDAAHEEALLRYVTVMAKPAK
jgi:cytochrome c5